MLRILPLNKKKKNSTKKEKEKDSFSIKSIFFKEKTCPECDNALTKNADGEMYCNKCGFVVLLNF